MLSQLAALAVICRYAGGPQEPKNVLKNEKIQQQSSWVIMMRF